MPAAPCGVLFGVIGGAFLSSDSKEARTTRRYRISYQITGRSDA